MESREHSQVSLEMRNRKIGKKETGAGMVGRSLVLSDSWGALEDQLENRGSPAWGQRNGT